MSNLWLDSETHCETPIKHGTSRYGEKAEVMLLSWALDDAEPQVWDLTTGEPCPADLEEHLSDPEVLVWTQNGDKFDWPVFFFALPWLYALVPQTRRRDTMVQAYSHSLPGNLDMMCAALGVALDKRKDQRGKQLIRLFCMLPPKNVKRERATRLTHPVEWGEFKDYAKQDIVAMRAAHHRMPMWNYKGKQLDLWFLDQKINARGICMDLDLAQAAIRATEISKGELKLRTQELTDDDVGSATQRDALLAHILGHYGVDLPNMQKDTIERRANDESLPEGLRELLRVRLESTTTSNAKYTALINGVNSDGRLRGAKQFRGAGRTGRVAHRLFQPGNMPRPSFKWTEIYWAIELIKQDCAHLVYSNVMKICSNAIRGTIVAPPGRKLVVADLANIEGRMAAWLAGEEWKLDAFRAYDAGLGPDLYLVAYASSFNVEASSIDPDTIEGYNQRQIGKVEELMFQYGGGVGAWITGAATYRIDLGKMTEQVWDVLPEWAKDEAADFLRWLYGDAREKHAKAVETLTATFKLGKMTPAAYEAEINSLAEKLEARQLKARYFLSEKTFITCDAIKRLWRKAHPEISSYWKELENIVKACINTPGITLTARKLKVRRDGEWLRIVLPSGRALCYPCPRVDYVATLPTGAKKFYPGISYLGISQYTRQWSRIGTYGGKLFENVVQAAACDQLLECQPAIEDAGFEIVLDVHDENITEVDADRDDLNAAKLGTMMCADLGWNAGLPLAAAGYEATRYRKE